MVDYDHLILLFTFLFLVLITVQLNKIYAYNDPMIDNRRNRRGHRKHLSDCSYHHVRIECRHNGGKNEEKDE